MPTQQDRKNVLPTPLVMTDMTEDEQDAVCFIIQCMYVTAMDTKLKHLSSSYDEYKNEVKIFASNGPTFRMEGQDSRFRFSFSKLDPRPIPEGTKIILPQFIKDDNRRSSEYVRGRIIRKIDSDCIIVREDGRFVLYSFKPIEDAVKMIYDTIAFVNSFCPQ